MGRREFLTLAGLMAARGACRAEYPRSAMRNFGLKVGMIGTVKFEARIKERVGNLPDLVVLVEPLLMVRRVIPAQFAGKVPCS